MYEEVILVGNKCDYDRKSWEVDTQTGKEVKQHCFFFCFFFLFFDWPILKILYSYFTQKFQLTQVYSIFKSL